MITEKEYIERNLQGFEGDTILAEKFKSIIDEYRIDTIIETGTFKGGTTKEFCKMAKLVVTFESNFDYYKDAQTRLKGNDNLIMIRGESQLHLEKVLKDKVLTFGNTIFFLDAHWEGHCPLLDELRIIGNNFKRPVIVIHDFKVPGRPDLGFDTYKGRPLEWSWIKDSVDKIYDNGYKFEYNSDAEGAKRGVIFIYPNNY